ncbi:hypothetical protein [Sinorhizobium alkalisoli]|uniref:hypothetical protein n=1 Tax=Sinorhizobium alkalisoli TaxID=1752398 RepID=UPI00178C7A72|nr:hypothetical protein [Sinorhizobium alkalisoli]MCA1489701.1 hypothetical protein [Ensifer sp. NBAIM29]
MLENAAELTCHLKLDGHCRGSRLRRNIKAPVAIGNVTKAPSWPTPQSNKEESQPKLEFQFKVFISDDTFHIVD